MNMAPIALHGLPKRLVDDHLIEAQDLEVATSVSAKTKKISLVQYLCEKKLLSDNQPLAIRRPKNLVFPSTPWSITTADSCSQSDVIDNKLLKKHQVNAIGTAGQSPILWLLQTPQSPRP